LNVAILVRRSNLLVRVADADAVSSAWRHNADAVTLDLEGADAVVSKRVRDAIASVAQGGAEVFVRASNGNLRADLEAAVWPGLRGIMLAGVDSAAQVVAADERVTALERERGMASGLQLIVVLDSARGVWNVRAIVTASPRISQAVLDEKGLAADLGITPLPEFDPFVYARGRVVVEAIAVKVNPVGIAYPLSVQSQVASPDEIHAHAVKGKNVGMKGVLCPHPDWVAPVNAAFTPTPDLVTYNKRVREAFAAGVAAGTAAVPLDGRMIDVPVDEWAIVVLATAEACAARDAEKQAAVSARQARG
jgi:citrate lyase subunit beta/citryl-CoA lyase